MRETLEGTVSLIRPPQPLYRLWWQFWRRHRELWDYGSWLMIEKPNVDILCRRMAAYVSPDLYWVTTQGSEPIVNAALAAGLDAYGSTSRRLRAGRIMIPDFRKTYGAFLDVALNHTAARLSQVKLSSPNALWMPAAGEPLRPWLEAQDGTIAVRNEKPDDQHVRRVREALIAFVLDDFDREILAGMKQAELTTC